MAKILENKMIVPNICMITVVAPEIAQSVKAGQFVIVRVDEDGERIPLTVSDWDVKQGTITLIYLMVGKTTQKLATMTPKDSLATVVGPLGNPMEIDLFGKVICIGGCYGNASLYPIARALKEKGNHVTVIVEARTSNLLYWQKKLKTVSDRLIFITRDGSQGMRGHIGNLQAILAEPGAPPDRVIVNGCNYLLMRAAEETRPKNIKTIVSLNTLMIDGTGMCGVCRLTVNSSTKFACVDGPHFDAHEVDWDELTQRRKAYLSEEAQTLRSSAAQEC
ncbi:MAG TPA: sulfide/dihydroorotate dehydrogenase-like FAD/NAD-binding protein [Anaerolineales bacterium]|nr:sulfide/dihydroorotate dehydrogenase-like FAD/NAD-binding protein [Anaerolineales bacterium]